MTDIRIHRFLSRTAVEGPGWRACIWVQGCSIRCPECAVPWTWTREGGTSIAIDNLLTDIIAEREIEGVTFVGGEPFEQAAALAELGGRVQRQGLSIVTFTGYRLEDIRAQRRADWDALLQVTDLLIDGPYKHELADQSRPWVGSSNQRFHFLTSRYEHLLPTLGSIRNRLEIHIKPNGLVMANGMADDGTLAALLQTHRTTAKE